MTNKNSLQKLEYAVPLGSLDAYIHWANQIPMLTLEEEQQLATDFNQKGNVESAKRLVMAHLRFVISVARNYTGYGLAHSDLIQEGSIGLMKAVDKFDPELGYKFSTYAYPWIREAALRFINENQTNIKVPVHSRMFNQQIKLAIKKYENENGKNITTRLMNDYVRSFHGIYPRDGGYERLVDNSLMSVDNYGLGLGLFSILKASKHLIDEELFNGFKRLFLKMSNFDVFQRPTPEEAFDRYKMLIVFTGLLDKYNMHIGDDELLVKGTEKKAEEKEIAKLPKATKKAIVELVEECADGKERNPKTRRCVDKCKEGHSRDADFKCKKNKTQKKKKQSKSVEIVKEKTPVNKSPQTKKCADDKELSSKTNRCVNKCKNGYSRDAEFNCKKTK